MKIRIVRPADDGSVTLTPGRYFLQARYRMPGTPSERVAWDDVVTELTKLIPRSSWGAVIESEFVALGTEVRDILIELDIKETIAIPASIMIGTGAIAHIPEGADLYAVNEALGGLATEQEGFWDWLAGNHPDVMRAALSAAETVKDTKEAIDSSLRSSGSALMWIAVALVVIVVVSKSKGKTT